LIAVVSCSHYPDDERIYYKEIKTLSNRKIKIDYYTLSSIKVSLSNNYINHINYDDSKHTIKQYIAAVKQNLLKFPLKVIHIHEPELFQLAIFTKKVFGTKIIYDVHEDYPIMINTFSSWNKYIKYLKIKFWIFKEKLFLRYVDEIIIASSTITNSGYKKRGFKPILLENFPLKFFIHSLKIKTLKNNSIIYHGNMGPERGIVELINAMPIVIKEIPDASLLLIGTFRTSSYKKEVNDAIDRLGLKKYISLKNHVLHSDIWDILECHKIGVIPFNDNPLTRYATPTKLFEFMAAGCQIVCPDLYPMRRYDVIGAHFFIPGDINSLGNSIIRAAKNMSNKNILKNQLKIKSDYNWDNNSSKLINLYKRLLS
jgi:glycosyltransferase involved in cell wall biosynthesis